MRSIATVTVAPSVTRLVTLVRLKQELAITDNASDGLLASKIDEATSDIEAHLGRTLARATISQTFWGNPGAQEFLKLDRVPVASIASVTVDDVAVDSTLWRLDAAAGILYRLDASGYSCFWTWCKSIVVVYAAGFLLPGENGRTLPPAIEAAAIDLVQSYWMARGRDPLVKAEDVPGLGSVQYWVGAIGSEGELPPGVMTKIAPFREPAA
jgi:hypothetical protein